MAGRIPLGCLLVVFVTLSETTCGHLSDSVMRQHNITCIFHAKRKLICDINADLTCSVCPHFRDHEIRPPHCPVGYKDDGCPVFQGRCLYDCGQYGYCREGHMVKISPSRHHLLPSSSTCVFVDTSRYIQPGPVRDLTLNPVNGTTVKIKWRKPADRDSDEDVYRYSVLCTHNNTHSTNTIRSAGEELEVFCWYPSVFLVYTVVVRARPRRYGYWSTPQTATVYITGRDAMEVKTAPATPEREFKERAMSEQKGANLTSSNVIGDTSGSLRSMVIAILILVSALCGVLLCTAVTALCRGGCPSMEDWHVPNQQSGSGVISKVFLSPPSAVRALLKSTRKKIYIGKGSEKATTKEIYM